MGIAQVFAQKGYIVNLIDIAEESLQNGMSNIDKNIDRMIAKELSTTAEKREALDRINTFTDLKKAVAGVQLVVEAASENLEIKQQVFKDLDNYCESGTILATNTSSISITRIAAVTSRADKVIGMHFMNPVSSRS